MASRLEAYGWPGNIRELRNAIDRAVLLAGDARITAEHLPADSMRLSAPGRCSTRWPARSMPPARRRQA